MKIHELPQITYLVSTYIMKLNSFELANLIYLWYVRLWIHKKFNLIHWMNLVEKKIGFTWFYIGTTVGVFHISFQRLCHAVNQWRTPNFIVRVTQNVFYEKTRVKHLKKKKTVRFIVQPLYLLISNVYIFKAKPTRNKKNNNNNKTDWYFRWILQKIIRKPWNSR